MAVKIQQVVFTAADLKKLPKEIREYLVLAGHMFNELMVIHRLYLFVRKGEANDIVRKVSDTWSLVLLRIMAGKLHEFWEVTRKRFLRAAWSQESWLTNNDDLQIRLSSLKKYFGGSNLIANVRNNFAFHYSSIDVGRTIASLGDLDELEMFLSKRFDNTTYHFSELAVTSALLDSINPDDSAAAFNCLMTDISSVANDALEFLNQVLASIFTYHHDSLRGQLIDQATLNVKNAPRVGEAHLPVFVAPDD